MCIGAKSKKVLMNILNGIKSTRTSVLQIILDQRESTLSMQKSGWARKKKKNTNKLGGKGKLTDVLIEKLTKYYRLAIRRNINSVPDMLPEPTVGTGIESTRRLINWKTTISSPFTLPRHREAFDSYLHRFIKRRSVNAISRWTYSKREQKF